MIRISDNIDSIIEDYQKNPMGLKSGINALDDAIRGLRPANLILIAGRSSMGKTALSLDIGLNVAKENPVILFSLEMNYEQLQSRALCNIAGLNHQKMSLGKGNKKELEILNKVAKELKNRNLLIDDYTSTIYGGDYSIKYKKEIPINSINTQIEKAIKFGCRLIIIDYLQLMRFGTWTEREDLRLHQITWELHNISKKKKIPIILLSQLRRFETERYKGKPDPRPRLDDLRDSGAIEQDSDIVLLLHRPNYYKTTEPLDLFNDNIEDNAEIIVAKNRNGAVGRINVNWYGFCMSFKNKEYEF